MVSDVEGMFHQVQTALDDCNALRFLWWPNDDLSKKPVDYQMLEHLFRATSSPSYASFCLKKTASDNQGEFDQETITTVDQNVYVDNCIKSVPMTDKGAHLSGQLWELLSRGGFCFTKWISNDRNVIATVPVTERVAPVVNLDLEDLPVERTLRVQWAMETDDFNFHIMDGGKAPTRRGILSVVSSMYDPLGFMALSFCQPKLLQSLCKQRYGWDEEISDADSTVWQEWLKELACLRTISVPRCFKPPGFGSAATFSNIISQMPLNMVMERYRTCKLSTTRLFHTVPLFLANLATLSDGSVHTTTLVSSCCCCCEVELPDLERVIVSHTRRNVLDGFNHSLPEHSQCVKKISHICCQQSRDDTR